MSIIRPNFAELFRVAGGRKVGGRPDLSASGLSESRRTHDPEESNGFIEARRSDPLSPRENELWLRQDKEPPELRLFSGGKTYAVPFAAVEAEPHRPLYPSASPGLRPPFYPRGYEGERPRYPRRNLRPPFYPRSY